MTTEMDDDLFFVWELDSIDSLDFEDTDEPRPLYVCMLCRDTNGRPDLIRGYSPQDGIFERPGNVVEVLGAIDIDEDDLAYRRQLERELLAEFEQRRESMVVKGAN